MTIMTLKINYNKEDLEEALKVFVSHCDGVFYEVVNDDKKDVLNSGSTTNKEIEQKK